MPRFSLVIEYLTGYAVATDPANRDQAEWPPHPARVFMALAAAHFETDPSNVSQREALEWLAKLDPPDMTFPEHKPRKVVTVYVPVNDMEVPKQKTIDGWNPVVQKHRDAIKAAMTILPSHRTNKQPRTFPRVHVGGEPLRLAWRFKSDGDSRHFDALESICRQVTRIGHSSSLVWVRLDRHTSVEPTLQVDASGLGIKLRTPFDMMLRVLQDDYGQEGRDYFDRLQAAIKRLESERKQIKGNGASERKKLIDEQINSKNAELTKHFRDGPPAPIPPRISHASSYSPVTAKHESGHPSIFDPNFIVLRESDDATQSFGIESAAQITQSLRGLIMDKSPIQPVPPWVGGHEPNGDKLESQRHMALIPLAFVGHYHADGHLMGIGIVLPCDLSYRDRAKVLSPILFDDKTNEPKTLELKMGRAGRWKLVRETALLPKQTLQTLAYTAPSRSWASVTPILLDRMPKTDRIKDPTAWREEVAGIIAQSCQRVGLPEPMAVRVEKTPFFRGSLRAMPGQGGFPQLRKGKFQVHAAIEFDRLVQGPMLLGAGRFRGYGLMRPWTGGGGR